MPRPVCTQKGRSPQKVKVTHGTAHSTEALRKTKLAFRAFRFFSSHCLSTLYDLSTGFTSHHWWMMRGVRESFSEEPPSPLLPTPPHREEKAPSLYLEILMSRKSVCCIAVVYPLTASTVVGNPQICDVPRQCFPFFAPGRANCWADCVPSVAGAGPLQQLAFGKFCRES